MRMVNAFWIGVWIFLLSIRSEAVISGIATPAEDVATLEISIGHKTWIGREANYKVLFGTCSSVVVGTRPLTLLTASHCVGELAVDEKTGLPLVQLIHLKDLGVTSDPKATKVISNSVNAVKMNGALDLAVIVFDRSLPRLRAVPIAKPIVPLSLQICGYGYSAKEVALPNPRCAEKSLVPDLTNLDLFIPRSYRESDPSLHLQFQAQFNSKPFPDLDRAVGINRLNEAGRYSFDLPMPREGDSGGPWFTRDEDGQLAVYAITSFGETFYRRNSKWPVFADKAVVKDDMPYAYYGVKVATPEAEALFAKARAAGADL